MLLLIRRSAELSAEPRKQERTSNVHSFSTSLPCIVILMGLNTGNDSVASNEETKTHDLVQE